MTIMQAPSYIFPSLANDTHIVGPMGEIICAFGHLSTQLTLVGLKVKMSMCKLWNPSGIFPGIRIHQHYIFVTDGLCIWVYQWVLRTLPHIFWMGLYLRTWHISMISFSLGNTHVVLSILFSCVIHQPSYLT
jgi:hypothetical protein